MSVVLVQLSLSTLHSSQSLTLSLSIRVFFLCASSFFLQLVHSLTILHLSFSGCASVRVCLFFRALTHNLTSLSLSLSLSLFLLLSSWNPTCSMRALGPLLFQSLFLAYFSSLLTPAPHSKLVRASFSVFVVSLFLQQQMSCCTLTNATSAWRHQVGERIAVHAFKSWLAEEGGDESYGSFKGGRVAGGWAWRGWGLARISGPV